MLSEFKKTVSLLSADFNSAISSLAYIVPMLKTTARNAKKIINNFFIIHF